MTAIMKLEVIIHKLPHDVASVTLDLRIDDHGEADAPARNLTSLRIGPLVVDPALGQVIVDLPPIDSKAEALRPAVNIQVKVQRPNGDEFLFVNTSEIPVPQSQTSVVTAEVFRVD